MKTFFKIFLIPTFFALVFSLAFADNVDGPDVFLKTVSRSVEAGATIKVSVTFSEPVTRFSKDEVSLDGGSLESVRKLGQTSYLLFIRADDRSREIDVQVEAGKVLNKSKVENAYASNALVIKITQPTPVTPASNMDNDLVKVLETATKQAEEKYAAQQSQTVQNSTNNNTQQQVSYYNCNGFAIPTTQQCQQQAYQAPVANTSGYYDAYGNYYPPTYSSNFYYQPPYTNPYYYNSSYNSYYTPSYSNNFWSNIFDW